MLLSVLALAWFSLREFQFPNQLPTLQTEGSQPSTKSCLHNNYSVLPALLKTGFPFVVVIWALAQ